MNNRQKYAKQLEVGIAEMEATIERLREDIQQLREERDALLNGNRILQKEVYDTFGIPNK